MTIKTGALLVLNTSISASSAMHHLQFFFYGSYDIYVSVEQGIYL